MKLAKSRFIEPYTKNGKSNISFAKGKTGVYLIAKEGKIVYVGYSQSNLEKTCLRHFQSWSDPTQVRVTYSRITGITVRVILTTEARAAALEKALIIKIQPKDNPNKLRSYLGIVPKSIEQILEEYEQAPCLTSAQIDDCPF